MKKTRNLVALLLCAMLLIGASVAGTLAYLTFTDTVENTFTVGQVKGYLVESDVDQDGNDKANSYKLIPGATYAKDPTLYIEKGSESCYVFVKVENGIADIEAADNTIEAQMIANGWVKLSGDIWYKADPVTASAAEDYEVVVFETFTIADDVTNDVIAGYKTAKITVTAYAVQSQGFSSASAAWGATFAD